MKQLSNRRRHPSALLAMLLLGLALAACDNEINVSPTAVTFPDFSSPVEALRTLHISGTLAAERGSCIKAMILFDGSEINGTRVRCPDSEGCSELDLAGEISAFAGHHTITFKVLRQSAETDDYLATGAVEVSRLDLNLPDPVVIELQPTRASLREGEGVTFEIALLDQE